MTRLESLQFQYLGASGDTYSCIEAVITTLVSPRAPSHFTVVFADWNIKNKDNTAVCFIAWNWLGVEITIIPDGFGTHQGTGGWGLSLALALIQTSNVRLEEVNIPSPSFARISSGKLTNSDIKALKTHLYGSPIWTSYLREEHEEGIIDGSVWRHASIDIKGLKTRLPKWMLGPDIYSVASTFEANPRATVTAALLKLEDTVRKLSTSDHVNVGTRLMGNAFGSGGKLRFKREVEEEADGWASLYRGVFSAIRNPLSHQEITLSKEEAIQYLIFSDMLLKKLRVETKQIKQDTLEKNTFASMITEEDSID